MRWRAAGRVGAGAVTAAALATLAWLPLHPLDAEPSQLVVGRYQPGALVSLGSVKVVAGSYRLGYSAEVQYFSQDPGSVLYCAFVDAQNRPGYFGGTSASVPGTGQWTVVDRSYLIDLPDVSLSLACTPSTRGPIGVAWRRVALTAVPLALR
jgi:hypothetical protein